MSDTASDDDIGGFSFVSASTPKHEAVIVIPTSTVRTKRRHVVRFDKLLAVPRDCRSLVWLPTYRNHTSGYTRTPVIPLQRVDESRPTPLVPNTVIPSVCPPCSACQAAKTTTISRLAPIAGEACIYPYPCFFQLWIASVILVSIIPANMSPFM